jgi:hypothetical protein
MLQDLHKKFIADIIIVKLPTHWAGLRGKETMFILHPFFPPTRQGLRDVLPGKKNDVSLYAC